MIKSKEKWNKTTSLFLITVLALENFAFLVPPGNYIIPGLIKFSDIGIIFAIIWTVWVYIGIRCNKKVKYRYATFIVSFIVINVISAYKGNELLGQPFSLGIRCLRNQLICFILYFPLTRALQTGAITKNNLEKIIFIVGTFELSVYTLQYVLVNKISFTYIDLDEIRGTTARIRFPYLFVLVLGFICFGKLLNGENLKKKNKIKYIIYVIWSTFLLAGICQNRAPTIITICTFIIGFIVWKKNIGIKFIIGTILAMGLVSIVINSTFIESAINGLINKGTKDDTLSIREDGQQYYLNCLKKSKIFGFGMPNENYLPAVYASGQHLYYYLADNGIFGFAYIYGIAGTVWTILLYCKNLKLGYKLYSNKKQYEYLLYFIYEVGNIYIGLHWFYYYTLPFVLMFTMLDYDYTTMINERRLNDD